jgi:hypothetical protein
MAGMDWWQILIGIVAVGLFIWIFFVPSRKAFSTEDLEKAEEARLIGALVGLLGGDIAQAATARYALRRFEEQYGRKPTMQELGIVVGFVTRGGGF